MRAWREAAGADWHPRHGQRPLAEMEERRGQTDSEKQVEGALSRSTLGSPGIEVLSGRRRR